MKTRNKGIITALLILSCGTTVCMKALIKNVASYRRLSSCQGCSFCPMERPFCIQKHNPFQVFVEETSQIERPDNDTIYSYAGAQNIFESKENLKSVAKKETDDL